MNIKQHEISLGQLYQLEEEYSRHADNPTPYKFIEYVEDYISEVLDEASNYHDQTGDDMIWEK